MRRHHAEGFTLVEVAAVLLLATIMLYALHATLIASSKGRSVGDRQELVHRFAVDYVDRLRHVPFGTAADTPATGPQLQEFFDQDDALGSITLHQVAVAANQPGHSFSVNSRGLVGRFRVKVSNDLDGDGSTLGPREGRDDLLRVEVFFADRPALATTLAAPPASTTPDATDYLIGS